MKSLLLPVLVSLIGCLYTIRAQMLSSFKKHDDCDLWAKEHGECAHNPRFMWTDCLGSCIVYSRNTHQSCDQWAHEGECTNNPSFMHINCPRSCAMAIAWSPWVRNKFEMEHLKFDTNLGRDRVDYPVDLFQTAEVMRDRLVKYFEGLYPVIPGFSPSAPTEYLGMMGIAEAVLYVLRLHEVVFRQVGTNQQIDFHYHKVNNILEVIRLGFSSDRLMLSLPVWLGELNESAILAATLLHELHHVVSIQGGDASGQAVSTYVYDNAVSFGRLADYYSTRATIPSHDTSSPISLNNGLEMPRLGLGTWQMNGEHCYEAVLSALRSGYRMIDSAEAYGNEIEIGRALKTAIEEGVVQREDVFLTTKASDEANMGYDGVKDLVKNQLERLQTDYIDLYFLHSPLRDKKKQEETWKALEELYEAGTIKALGVSNFDSNELSELIAHAQVKPAVVQNKYDIYHLGKQIDQHGDRILKYAQDNGIVLMAYSPFSAFPFVLQPLADPIVAHVAHAKSEQWNRTVTPAQILLKWTLQHGVTAIPRSSDPARQKENLEAAALPALDSDDMKLLDIIQLLVSSPVSVPVLHEDAPIAKEEDAPQEAAAVEAETEEEVTDL